MASSRIPGVIGKQEVEINDISTFIDPYQSGISHPIGLTWGSKKKRAAKRSGGKEITIVGDFLNPWGSNQEEIAGIKSGFWFPSTDDFVAVVNNSTKMKKGETVPIVGSSESLIHVILGQSAAGIRRLNILTHGNEFSIGLSGDIDTDGSVDFNEELDIDVFNELRVSGIKYKGKTVKWKEVRDCFVQGAEIYVLACKSGLSQDLLKKIADSFGVTVKAFARELDYYITIENGHFHRSKIKIAKHVERGDSAKTSWQLDFHQLTPDITMHPEQQTEPLHKEH